MPWPKMPGPAFWSIVLTAALLLTATIAGYLEGDSWNTLSDMITRNSRLRNAFALFVGIMVICQGFYTFTMYKRWANRAALYKHEPTYAPAVLVTLGYLMSLGGSVGFAIVSTDISQDEHVTYAAIAFAGIYVYLVTFGLLAWYYPSGNGAPKEENGSALWPKLAAAFLVVPILALIVYAVCDCGSAYGYVWEFIFIVCMLGAACSLYVEDQSGKVSGRKHEPVKLLGLIKVAASERRDLAFDLVF